MRGRTPTLHCDGDDGDCGAWDVDYYQCDVTAVNDVTIRRMERAPGWVSTADGDYCPEHVAEGEAP